MHRCLPILIFVAATAPLGASAQESATHEFAGLTSIFVAAFSGALGMTDQCQADFGSEARMCNSVEVLRTTNTPGVAGTASGWVRPVLGGSAGATFDASGAESAQGLSCSGWSTTAPTFDGLLAFGDGRMIPAACNTPNIRATCCTPISPPAFATVPSMLWLGRGLFAALILSAGAGMILFGGRRALPSGERGVVPRS